MAVIETWFEQDLQKPVKVRYIDGNLFSHNGNGNRIGVIVTNNGEAVTLTGTVSGYAVLADGTTVPCTGTRSGNKASILVPAAAYSPGRILISIFLTDGTTVTTLAALSSSVIMARTGNQIDPGSVVTDWTNTINAAMQSVETAAANLGNIVATSYANLTFPVPLGKYTIYNNGLYRCISPIASSEAWTAAHWTNVKLGDDVADLKSILDTIIEDSGVEITHEKSIAHTGTINQSLSEFDLVLKSGTEVKITLIDANNIGYVVALYVRYKGQSSNTTLNNNAKVGTTYTYTLQNDTEFFSLYTSGATASTLLFQIVASNPANTTMLSRIGTLETEMNSVSGEVDKKAPFGCVGFNVWDEEWETNAGGTYIRSKNLIEVMPGTDYYLCAPNNFSYGVKQYNANKDVIKTTYPGRNVILTTESSTKYLSFSMDTAYGTTYNNNICINISQPNANIEPHNGQYVPYGYIGVYRDVLKNKSDVYTQTQAFNTEKSNTAKTLLEVSQKTGATLKDISTHSHGTVLNQSTTQTNISIPKNYKVTISFSDANVEGNGAVYLRYKNSESAILLAGSVLMNGGSYTFVTTNETEYFSLYKNTGVTAGTMTITIDYHYEDSLIGLPTHYVDHMVTQTASVLSNMMTAGKNGETFIFISDLHWENNVRNSPALIKYLLDNLNINFLLCGGDLINEGTKDAEAKNVVECIRSYNFKNTFFPCAFGNHDSNKNANNPQERWFSENDEYALMQKQAEDHITYFTETGWNFYFDAKQTKTRWIVCDTQENGTFSWYDELCSLLNETPEGYHVIISGHWFYDSGSKSTFAVNLESIVDAFNARSSVTISSTPYSFANAKGSIPFVIGGHMHKDMDWTTTAGIPFILTDCDNGPRSGNTDYPYVKGTITEQAFDVVTVDYENETVKCVRIGRGADRNFTF